MQPACFGSAVAVSHQCRTCVGCHRNIACVSEAARTLGNMGETPALQRERQRLALVRQAFGQAGAGAQTATRVPLSQAQRNAMSGLSSQVASMAKNLFERGWFDFARSELRAGRNPGRNDWQRLLCSKLLEGGIARGNLQMAFVQTLEMTPGSAKVRASKAISLFHAGGLLVERGGCLVLNPN